MTGPMDLDHGGNGTSRGTVPIIADDRDGKVAGDKGVEAGS